MAKAKFKRARKRPSKRPDAQSARRANTDKSARVADYLTLPTNVTMFEMPDAPKRATSLEVEMDCLPSPVKRDRLDGIRKGFDWWNLPFKLHKTSGQGRIVCPSTYGEPCPICEKVSQWYNDYEANEELIKYWRATDYDMYLIRGEEARTYQIYLQPNFFFGKHLKEAIKIRENKGEPDADYFYEHDGLNESIILDLDVEQNAKFGTQYKANRRGVDFAKRKIDVEDWVAFAPSLDELLVIPTYDEVFEVFDPSQSAAKERDGKQDTTDTKEEPQGRASSAGRGVPSDAADDDVVEQAEIALPDNITAEDLEEEIPDDELPEETEPDAAPTEEEIPDDELPEETEPDAAPTEEEIPDDDVPFDGATAEDDELPIDDDEIPDWTEDDPL